MNCHVIMFHKMHSVSLLCERDVKPIIHPTMDNMCIVFISIEMPMHSMRGSVRLA